MSGQQPPYGGPPPGQPPHGGSPPPYGQPQPGQPQPGPPSYGQPQPGPYGQPPAQGMPPQGPQGEKRSRSIGPIITIVVLVLLVIGLGGLSGYLWSQDSDDSTASSDSSSESGGSDDEAGSALNASTEPVKLPKQFGDYEVSSIDSYGGNQYEKEYEKALGASVDLQEYSLKDPAKSTTGAAAFLTVVATRAELPVVPAHGPDLEATTKFVRDDMTCWLEDFASKGTKPTPQRCMRVGDGLTVEVNAFTSGDAKNAPTVKEFAKLTDQAYEAIK